MSEKELPPPSLWRTIFNLLPLIILTLYLCQNRPGEDPKYQLDACGKNLHTIGVALEKDRLLSEEKLYNQKLEDVFSKGKLPECPNGGTESYLEGYQLADDRASYLLVCKGEHHKDASVPSDFPRIAFSVLEAHGSDGSSENKEDESVKQDAGDKEPEVVNQQEEQKAEPEASPEPQKTPEEVSEGPSLEASPKPE